MPTSLGGRLLLGSGLFTTIALVVTLIVMNAVLQRFVTGQIDQRLDNKIVALASQVHAERNGVISLSAEADGPPFDKPRHRSFWWVRGPANSLRTSWLRDGDYTPPDAAALEALPTPPRPPEPGPDEERAEPVRARTLAGYGPQGAVMHLREAETIVDGVPVTIFVGAPEAAIIGPMRTAMTTVGLCVAALGLALMLATIAQIRLGLRPLARLRTQISSIRKGGLTQLPTAQPSEIRPLVLELNSLLTQNAENLSRARRHVANLAHGLKTPLATLSLTVERMESDDRAALRDLVAMIERRIRHHLGRARAAALDGPVRASTPLYERIGDLIVALERLYADKSMSATIVCAREVAVACELQDVDEILGNILENAFKFGKSEVACSVVIRGRFVEIDVSDDGPGLTAEQVGRVMKPGQRLDETVPGYGFGLSIARELAELYGGTMTGKPGDRGLTMQIVLPAGL